MNNILKIIGLTVISAYSMAVQAIPTLYFDGNISYNASSSVITVDARLTTSVDIAPIPLAQGSSMDFSAILAAVDSATNPGITIGYFGSNLGVDDLTINDGNNNLLLSANFTNLAIFGADGNSSGNVYGFITATGGPLASYFGDGNLVALQLNLTTVYNSQMFNGDWDGNIDGNLQGEFTTAPEPGMVSLIALGLLLVGFSQLTTRKLQHQYKNHK